MSMTKEQAAAAACAMEQLEAAEEALAQVDPNAKWALAGKIRLVHIDGWSPGYLTPGDDDWWEFTTDYVNDVPRDPA